MEVADWLQALGLERYETAFRENGVSTEDLCHLTAEDLEGLGVTAIGHRRRLLVAITKLNEQRTTKVGRLAVEPATAASGSLAADAMSQGGERRQLTVMFCDLVGSTALSEKLDPEELGKLLHAYRTHCGDVIARYDGFVARYVGDGILTYFGWPTAHEEDAERTVRAALEIVHTVKQASSTEDLSVRIGIATGSVVVGETAGTGDQSKLAVGSTPNFAARLQGLAIADQIVIATSTRRLVGNAFELTDLGENDLKGIAEPVHAWRVERALVTESRFDASHGVGTMTPLIGREEELDLLLRRWSQARDGEGQVVLLSGEPGIGKSRILGALRERLGQQGVQALRFQCSPYYVNSAFWPIIDNLERTLKFARDETTDVKLDKLEALIVTQYGRPLADVRFVASILSIPCEQRHGARLMTPQKHKDETLRTLVDIFEAAARQQPSAILFEDAHWCDPTTLEVLDLLIDRVKTVPLLVVLTHRPEFQSRWSEQGHVVALNLSKLTRTQSATMVSTLVGGKELPGTLLEQILTRTDGVPLFVEELTKSILESSELTEAGDHYEFGGFARAVTIPATLRDLLMARLDRFMPVKEIAQIGAAIGREFSYELIAAVAPMPQAQFEDSLVRLTESGLAFRRGTPPDAIYTFKHALVQDAAYDSLLKSRRQELHAKIAREIEARFPNARATEPEVLAHHLTEAGLSEGAVPLWQVAGDLASKRMALAEAIALFNRGLELVAALPPSLQRDTGELGLRTRLGTAWLGLKGWGAAEVWTSLHPALALAKSLKQHETLVPILWGLAINILAQGRVAESLNWAQEMLGLARSTRETDLLIAGHMLGCICSAWMGEFAHARDHARNIFDIYDEERHQHLADILNQDPETVARIWDSICTWVLGYQDQASRLEQEKDAQARRRGHPFNLGAALFIGPNWWDRRLGYADLRKRAEEIDRVGQDNDLPFLSNLMARYHYAAADLRLSNVGAAIPAYRDGVTAFEAAYGKQGQTHTKAMLAEVTLRSGAVDDALQLLDEVIEQIERPGWEERLYYAETLRLRGCALLLKGDPEGAERNFRLSLEWGRRQQAKSWELRTVTSLARLWQDQGKCQQAYELLAPVYEWFTEGFDSPDLLEAKSLLAELG